MASEMQQPGVQSGPPQVSGPRAGFGSRLGAYVIDIVIVLVVQLVIGFVFGFIFGAAGGSETSPVVILIGNLINIAVALLYFGLQEGSARGQTVGKRALGIRVIDFNTGQSIGVARAILRNVARILSAIPLALGYLWMLWDPQKQTWHDKLIGDVVVPESSYPIHAVGGGYTPPQTGPGNY